MESSPRCLAARWGQAEHAEDGSFGEESVEGCLPGEVDHQPLDGAEIGTRQGANRGPWWDGAASASGRDELLAVGDQLPLDVTDAPSDRVVLAAELEPERDHHPCDVASAEDGVAPGHRDERAVLERAPVSRRNARRLWRVLGLRLGPRHSPGHVQGWKIAASGDDWLRIETASWYLTAQAVCLVEEGRVSLSLSLRYDRRVAALVWALVSGPHQRAVPVMLQQAVRLMTT